MKIFRPTTTLAPVAAAAGAMVPLACCLPWSIGVALGALGLGVFIARFQPELIVLAVILLSVGLIQIPRRGRSCRRHGPVEIAIWGITVAIVLAVVLFPEWVANLLAGRQP